MRAVYVVEDDDNIREIVCYALNAGGFAAAGFPHPEEFWRHVREKTPGFVILDIMLPGEDGLSILKKLKADERTKAVPVIMLTARGLEMDRIRGLDLGADDYVAKPFSVMELISRVKAVLRRCGAPDEEDSLNVGTVGISAGKRSVTADGRAVTLTYTEFELLHCLMRNAGIVLSREKLMQRVWGVDAELESRTVDMHIKALRQKLGAAGEQIKTVRSVGYKMEAGV